MSDIYRIGVSIALANGISPVLAIISRDLLGLKTKIGDIENQFGRWATAAGGVAAILGGTAILGGMAKWVEYGKELVHQQELMKIAGMDNAEIAAATAKAYEVSAKVQTTTISQNLEHLRELRYAFGNIDVAQQYIEQVSKANAILGSVKGGGADQVWELVKSLEQKGETADPASFMKYVDIMTQAVISSGGRVTPAQFFSAFKYGRTAMLGWDETFVGQYLPRLIQSMSGGGASGGSGSGGPGNALMSAFAKVVQGQMPKKAAEEFAAMGLAAGVEHIKGSSQSTVGRIAGADLFQHNPYEWVQTVLMPALASHGITTQEQIIEEISKLFPVRTASQVIAEMGLQGRFREGAASPFEKDAALARDAMTTAPAFGELAAKDPTMIMKAFTAQWEAMLQAIGSPMVAPAMDVMKEITGLFTSFGQTAGRHPEALRYMAEAIAAIGVALLVIGGIALGAVVASTVGVTALIVAVVAALGTLAALNWGAISSGLASLESSISGFIQWLANQAAPISGPINDFIHKHAPQGGGDAPIGDPMGLVPIPQNYQGPQPETKDLMQKANWMPPARGSQPIQITASLNIDGRTISEVLTEKIAELYAFPNSAATHEGMQAFNSPDWQIAGT